MMCLQNVILALLLLGILVAPLPATAAFSLHAQWSRKPTRRTATVYEPTASSLDTDTTTTTKDVIPGCIDGFVVVQRYNAYTQQAYSTLDADDSTQCRLGLTPDNITVPVALMLLDPVTYPSISRARRACRKQKIVLYRNNNHTNAVDRADDSNLQPLLARVGDRVYPGDVLAVQERITRDGAYSTRVTSLAKPKFDLPVLYEDDFMAIVNKPAGIAVYEPEGIGKRNVRFALPHVLKSPRPNTPEPLSRPVSCHRLDKPTSGLLVVSKTRPATIQLCKQFKTRQAQKTYTAIVQGLPQEPKQVTSRQAFEMGFDVEETAIVTWNLAETMLDDKIAVTLWRIIDTFATRAPYKTLSLVELKPKTGRKHQLRRQMAYMYHCPIVGDTIFGGAVSNNRWKRGLMLCANRIVLKHPACDELLSHAEDVTSNPMLNIEKETGQEVMITTSIDLPNKFLKFLQAEQKKALYAGENYNVARMTNEVD